MKIWAYINKRITLLLLFAAVILIVLRIINLQLILNRQLQFWLFPLALLAVWKMPHKPQWRIPGVLIGGALFCWALSALHVQGFFYGTVYRPPILLAELNKDDSDLYSQQMKLQYRDISRYLVMPKLSMLHRKFAKQNDAYRWWQSKAASVVFIYGQKNWADISVAGEDIARYIPTDSVKHNAERWIAGEAKKYDLREGRDYFSLASSPQADLLLLALTPEAVHVPLEPMELILQVIGFLGKALNDLTLRPVSLLESEKAMSQAQSALSGGLMVHGSWKSLVAQAFMHFLRGNFFLLRATLVVGEDRGLVDCAVTDFQRAAGKIMLKTDPFIMAAIINNLAVAKMQQAQGEEDYKTVVRLLMQAAAIVDKNGLPVRGGRLAFLNLILLDKQGVK
ncbi:MAG: hypothetical protein IT292_03960 [Deltaproteobacteria bacterium]|nr:hypothetical protein [Deltaproteobacteria bacterium]